MSREQRHIKAAIVGPKEAEKIALAKLIIGDAFSIMNTKHRKIYDYLIEGELVELELWNLPDRASPDQKIQMLNGAHLVLVVHDLTDSASLEKVRTQIEIIQKRHPKAQIALLSNTSYFSEPKILGQRARALAEKHHIPFHSISIQLGQDIAAIAVDEILSSVATKKSAKKSLFNHFFAPKSSASPKEAAPGPGPGPAPAPSPADEESPASEREMLYVIEQFLLFFRAIRPNHLTEEMRQELLDEEITMSDRIQNASLYVSLRHDIVRTEYLLSHHFYLEKDLKNKALTYFRPGQLPQVVGFLQNVLEHIEDPAITKEQKRELLSQLDETIQKVTTLLAQPECIWKESCKLDKLPCGQGIPKEIESQFETLLVLMRTYNRLVNPAAKPIEAGEAPRPLHYEEKWSYAPPKEAAYLAKLPRSVEPDGPILPEQDWLDALLEGDPDLQKTLQKDEPLTLALRSNWVSFVVHIHLLNNRANSKEPYSSLCFGIDNAHSVYKPIVLDSFLLFQCEKLLGDKFYPSINALKGGLFHEMETHLHALSPQHKKRTEEIYQAAMDSRGVLLMNRIFAQQKEYRALADLLCTLEKANPNCDSVARWLSGGAEPSNFDKQAYYEALDLALEYEYEEVVRYLLINPVVQKRQVDWGGEDATLLERTVRKYSARSAKELNPAAPPSEGEDRRVRIVHLLLQANVPQNSVFMEKDIPAQQRYFLQVVRAALEAPVYDEPPSYDDAAAEAAQAEVARAPNIPGAFFNEGGPVVPAPNMAFDGLSR